ncbi:MAG: hypothetical protein FWF68_00495 [Spirochaetes bacterium]|nr:hypothetical protein [Spirochaetota bacterium]
MKRFPFFLSFAPVLLLLSCNLQLPNAVQVKGSPELRFATKFDIGEHLEGLINKDSFTTADKVELLDCVNKDIVTYLVYMEVYDEKVSTTGLPAVNGTTTSDVPLTTGNISVPAFTFDNEFKDFKFNQENIKTKLYISGPSIVEGITVKLTMSPSKELAKSKANNKSSGLKDKTKTYNGTELPDGGFYVNDLPFDGAQLNITYTILVAANTTIKADWLNNNNSKVLVELAIWLPFEFKADKDGANLPLPDDLFSDGDLFGRENSDGDNTVTKMLESINFAMKMNTKPFEGAFFIVNSTGINIRNPIKSASLEFALNENDMKTVNNPANFPFAPKFKIVFNQGGTLKFPREFYIKEISFNAKFSHTIDLAGGIN